MTIGFILFPCHTLCVKSSFCFSAEMTASEDFFFSSCSTLEFCAVIVTFSQHPQKAFVVQNILVQIYMYSLKKDFCQMQNMSSS